jgi:hypothetical protein
LRTACIIWIAFLLVGYQVQAQDSSDVKVLPIFQSKLERQLITQFESQPFFLLQSLDAGTNIYHDNWESLVMQLDKLAEKKKSNVQLLSDIFFDTHNRMLRNYTTFASFASTLATGAYDCVTGTAVMGLLLERYGIAYTIIELQGHVYIRGIVEDVPFVMESTQPINGLLIGTRRVRNFEKKISQTVSEPILETLNERIGQRGNSKKQLKIAEIGLKELGGLQYYNDAIRKFESGTFDEAYVQLIKAELLYPSPRIQQFKVLMEALILAEK